MRPVLALFSLAVALSATAYADTTDTFTFSGVDTSGSPLSVTFGLNPGSYTDTPTQFVFSGLTGSFDDNGTIVADTFSLSATPDNGEGYVSAVLADNSTSETLDIFANATDFLSGDPSMGGAPTVTSGSYDVAVASCLVYVRSPSAAPLPTLALFQMPSIAFGCAPVSLGITAASTPSSVTPEPSTLALFATGALGLAGVLRRRFHA